MPGFICGRFGGRPPAAKVRADADADADGVDDDDDDGDDDWDDDYFDRGGRGVAVSAVKR